MKMHVSRTETNLLILFEFAKRLYYEKQIEKLKSNVKATWKVLNEILNRNKGKRGCHLYLGQILEKFPIQRK